MKIVISPDSFKDSLSSEGVCNAIESGLLKILSQSDVEIIKIPMSDGGEGFIDVLAKNKNITIFTKEVPGPLEDQVVVSKYGWNADTKIAYVALAESAGLEQVPVELRNPLNTSTYGVGVLIKYIFDTHSPELMIIGAGGSATHDCGMGCVSALSGGERVTGRNFDEVELPTINTNVKIQIATDVNCLLNGKNGARMFDAQKGATTDIEDELETKTKRWSELHLHTELPGDGAAGGFPAGLRDMIRDESGNECVSIISGVKFVDTVTSLSSHIKDADYVITGEGRFDSQTSRGKVVSHIQSLCNPFIVCGGSEIEDDNIFQLATFYSKTHSMEHPSECIEYVSQLIAKRIFEETKKQKME